MTSEKLYEICEKANKRFQAERLYAEIYPYNASAEMPVIDVEINWGDWKHEHGRAKWLMGLMGARLIGTQVTEEDGSDCYSAVHHFYVGEDFNEEAVDEEN